MENGGECVIIDSTQFKLTLFAGVLDLEKQILITVITFFLSFSSVTSTMISNLLTMCYVPEMKLICQIAPIQTKENAIF